MGINDYICNLISLMKLNCQLKKNLDKNEEYEGIY